MTAAEFVAAHANNPAALKAERDQLAKLVHESNGWSTQMHWEERLDAFNSALEARGINLDATEGATS